MGNASKRMSVSAAELGAVLDEGGEVAGAIRQRFDRSMLWRLRTGRRQYPQMCSAVVLRELTGGRISLDGWAVRRASGPVPSDVGMTRRPRKVPRGNNPPADS